MSLRIFVTGGAGYLGSVLCERLLDAGYYVTALDSLMYQQNSLFYLYPLCRSRIRS
jgi:nucleoside-diphosphate-sugar epimerase